MLRNCLNDLHGHQKELSRLRILFYPRIVSVECGPQRSPAVGGRVDGAPRDEGDGPPAGPAPPDGRSSPLGEGRLQTFVCNYTKLSPLIVKAPHPACPERPLTGVDTWGLGMSVSVFSPLKF